MAKVAKIVGVIAGVVAVVATLGAALPGLGALMLAEGLSLAGAASALSIGANVVAQIGAKPPISVGTINETLIGTDNPYPIALGRTYCAGALLHDVAHGDDGDAKANAFRDIVVIYSGCGPIEQIESFQVDHTVVSFSAKNATSNYFHDYLHADFQLGATPESDALVLPSYRPVAPGWGPSHKLSGLAAGLISFRWDVDGKLYSSGVPDTGTIVLGVHVYDPRQDSTYPGGSGPCRIDQQSTYVFSKTGPLQALTYAYGYYQNGKQVAGGGLSENAIAIDTFVALANVAEANGWECNGVIYEAGAKGEIWNNLKMILQTCSAKPTNINGVLSATFNAPVIPVDTITDEDIVGECTAPGMQPWDNAINTLIPKYRSEQHRWEYVNAAPVAIPALVTSDGEERKKRTQYDLVTDETHVSQLAVYDMYDKREIGPIQLTVGPRFALYVEGDALTLNINELGLNHVAKITKTDPDIATGKIRLTLVTDTAGKHPFALGQTGVAPPVPTLQTTEELDEIAHVNTGGAFAVETYIRTSWTEGATITATDAGSDVTVTLSAHTRQYSDRDVSVAGATFTELAYETTYWIYYDDEGRSNETPTYIATTDAASSQQSVENPFRHYVGNIPTPAAASDDVVGQPVTALGYVQSFMVENLLALGDADQTISVALDAISDEFGSGGRVFNLETTSASQASQLTGLVSTVGTNTSTIAILSSVQAGQASQISTLSSEINTPSTGILARLTNVDTAITNLPGQYASISSLNSLTATVNGQSTTLISHSTLLVNSTSYFASHGTLVVDGQGRVTGFRFMQSDGTAGAVSAFIIYSSTLIHEIDGTAFLISTSDGVTFKKAFRVQDSTSSPMTVLGSGFGSTGNLILWAGDAKSSNAQCTFDNAGFAVRRNSNGTFDINLSGGSLVNSVQLPSGTTIGGAAVTSGSPTGILGTTSTSSSASASWTHGSGAASPSPIFIEVNYHFIAITGGLNIAAADITATIVIERRYKTLDWQSYGAWSTLTTLTFSGHRELDVFDEPGFPLAYIIREEIGGSLKFYTAANSSAYWYQYRVKVTARGNAGTGGAEQTLVGKSSQ